MSIRLKAIVVACIFVSIATCILSIHADAQTSAEAELVEVRRIWDQARHNAFTDLIRFQDQWYCAFREGKSHVCDTGKLRVLTSTDTQQWTSVALMAWDGGDVRDAKLSVAADGRLMLSGAVRFLKPKDGQTHQSVAW
ncbi:MAG: exo-alpha-sialidase, partial [Pirellulaceae bacterium]|nr:exo-alpha-sialidase [Pirellulaceae bacterium]